MCEGGYPRPSWTFHRGHGATELASRGEFSVNARLPPVCWGETPARPRSRMPTWGGPHLGISAVQFHARCALRAHRSAQNARGASGGSAALDTQNPPSRKRREVGNSALRSQAHEKAQRLGGPTSQTTALYTSTSLSPCRPEHPGLRHRVRTYPVRLYHPGSSGWFLSRLWLSEEKCILRRQSKRKDRRSW